MRKIPTIFSDENALACRRGLKTKSRRIVKPGPGFQPTWLTPEVISQAPSATTFEQISKTNPDLMDVWAQFNTPNESQKIKGVFVPANATLGLVRSPYGAPGDIICVKETHYLYGHFRFDPKAKTGQSKYVFVENEDYPCRYSDNPPADYRVSLDKKEPGRVQWYRRVARYMPAKHVRTELVRGGTRIERVQDITEADAIAEGIEQALSGHYHYRDYLFKPGPNTTKLFPAFMGPIDSFTTLWNSIHGPGAWDRNDWVWVIDFTPKEQYND